MDLINVKDRLPKESEQVICYNEVGDWYELGGLINGHFYDNYKRGTKMKVTHWAPLPKKPVK